jgi:hypothetical protein
MLFLHEVHHMHRGLRYRDQWESKLLRTSNWSPLH